MTCDADSGLSPILVDEVKGRKKRFRKPGMEVAMIIERTAMRRRRLEGAMLGGFRGKIGTTDEGDQGIINKLRSLCL